MSSVRKFTVTPGLVVAAMVLAACGSSGSDSDDSGLGKNQGGLTGEPLKVMAIAPVATPIQDYPDQVVAVKAATDDINENGGVNGSPIELITCNDKSDANGAVACAREAVDAGVVAVVSTSVNGATMYPVLQKAGIAVIAQPQTEPDWTTDGVYPTSTSSVASGPAAPFAFADEGLKSVQFVRTDVAANAYVGALVEETSKKAGIEYKGEIAIPVDATDFAPYVQQLKKSGAEAVAFNTSAAQGIQFIRAARQLGLEAVFSHNSGTFGNKELAELGAAAEGMILIDGSPSPAVGGLETIDRLNKAMDEAQDDGVTGADKRGSRTSNAWLDVHALAEVLNAAGTKAPFTAEAVSQALKGASEVDVEGVFQWTPSAPGVEEYPHVANGNLFVSTAKADGTLELKDEKLDYFARAGFESVSGN